MIFGIRLSICVHPSVHLPITRIQPLQISLPRVYQLSGTSAAKSKNVRVHLPSRSRSTHFTLITFDTFDALYTIPTGSSSRRITHLCKVHGFFSRGRTAFDQFAGVFNNRRQDQGKYFRDVCRNIGLHRRQALASRSGNTSENKTIRRIRNLITLLPAGLL